MANICILGTIIPYGNKGDEAIYETSVELIRRYCPDSEISLVSFSTPGFEPDHQQLHYLYKLDKTISYPVGMVNEIAKGFRGHRQTTGKFASRIDRFWYWDLSPLFSLLVPPRRLRSFNRLDTSDVFVIVGHPLVKGLLPMCLRAYSMKMKYSKPSLVFPFSISLHPLSKPKFLDSIIRHNIRTLLGKMDAVLLREKYSMEYLRDNMGLKENLILSADTSFLLPPADEKSTLSKLEKMGIVLKKPAIVICPRGDYFKNAMVREEYHTFVHRMGILVDELVGVLGFNVYFVPMTTDEDSFIIDDICRMIRHKEGVQIVDTKRLSAKEVKTLFSHVDFLMTMRLHAAILAASACVPSAVMMTTQDLKAIGVAEDLGLSEYFICLEDAHFTAKKMFEIAVDLYENLEDKKRLLKEKLPIIQKRSELAGQALKRLV